MSDITPDQALKLAFDHLINARPSDADYAVIGRIALQHTGLEYQLESLVWDYMGDVDKGHIATSRLGNSDRIDMLRTLVEWTEPEDSVADAISWALDCFNVLRSKRNTIIHGFNFEADRKTGTLRLERRKRRELVFGEFEEFEFSPADLQKLSGEQIQLSQYMARLRRLLRRRGLDKIGPNSLPPSEPSPLPYRPPEPETLIPLPREAPSSARSQRRASQELAAREKKAAHKAQQREDAKKKR